MHNVVFDGNKILKYMPAFFPPRTGIHKRVTKFDLDLTEYEHCCLSQVLHQLIIKKRKI